LFVKTMNCDLQIGEIGYKLFAADSTDAKILYYIRLLMVLRGFIFAVYVLKKTFDKYSSFGV